MTSKEENVSKNEVIKFDSSALNGFRGFAAFHVLIFHSILFSKWGYLTYGNVSTYFSSYNSIEKLFHFWLLKKS